MNLNETNILVAEDDHDILKLILLHLENEGASVTGCSTLKNAQELISTNQFNLILLDRMLPDGNGVELCRFIRQHANYKNVPLIFITAMTSTENIIEGLDAGADDYITKPFDINILSARIRSQLRRLNPVKSGHIVLSDLCIKPEQREVTIGSKLIKLTQSEFDILYTLAKSDGIVLTRDKLIQIIFGADIHVTSRTIDTHMVSLRKKMGDTSKYIETIRGVGYRFNGQ